MDDPQPAANGRSRIKAHVGSGDQSNDLQIWEVAGAVEGVSVMGFTHDSGERERMATWFTDVIVAATGDTDRQAVRKFVGTNLRPSTTPRPGQQTLTLQSQSGEPVRWGLGPPMRSLEGSRTINRTTVRIRQATNPDNRERQMVMLLVGQTPY